LKRSLVAFAVATSLFGFGAAGAQKLDIESFVKAPAVTGISMSREGTLLTGLVADPRNPNAKAIAVWDISKVDGTKALQPTSITPGNDKMGFAQAGALKAGKIIAIASQPATLVLNGCGEGKTTGATKTWAYKFYVTDEKIQKFDQPFSAGRAVGVSAETLRCLETGATPSIIDLPLDPENIIVGQVDPASFQTRFSKVNLASGKSETLFRDTGDLSIGLIDPRDGKVRTRNKIEPKGGLEYDSQTFILNPDTGKFDLEAPLTVDFTNRHTMSVTAFDEETGKYFVVTDKFSDKTAVYLYDARTDKFDDAPLFAHKDFDAGGVILGRSKSNFGKILGFSYSGGDQETFWVDPTLKSIQDGLAPSFKGQRVDLISWTDDFAKVLFMTESPKNPPSYYLLLNKSKVLGVGNERPWIKPDTLGERSLIYYEARDGLQIPAFLTLPPGFKKGDAAPPAVVLPHGGPWARDFLGWDGSGWTQVLATRGYAVLQPQYRGSEGWGHKLWVSGDAEWGQKMQDDKDDGANWLVKEGYATPGRIGIFGYSYGGFAAFAASVRANGPFKCAVAGAGVSNLARIGANWGENREQRAYQGRTVKGMDPLVNASKLAMPILIFHGDHDVRVPLFHSTDFYNAVKGTGKAKILVLKDMGHQGDKWTPQNTRDSLNAIVDFFANDCKL